MAVPITSVQPQTPAARTGLVPGDTLCAVNGHAIRDVLDYKFYTYDTRLRLSLKDKEGKHYEVSLLKREGEDLGLVFTSYLMDAQKRCANRCVFCFIDQMPKGLRDSLYVKDDDARLSFLLGNYITMTNLSEADVERLIRQGVSPLHISVHATDPDVRRAMLRHPAAGECLPLLRRLCENGLQLHLQIVLCPGYNDGAVFAQTLADLTALCPQVQSISVVPVGLTAHREGLTPLTPVTGETARETLACLANTAARCRELWGMNVVYASDEVYLLAGEEYPSDEAYDGYPQLENGVGLLRLFETEFLAAAADCTLPMPDTGAVIATGVAAAPFLRTLLAPFFPQVPVVAVVNRLLGESVTVAGLVSGGDLTHTLAQWRAACAYEPRVVLISESMLRHEGDLFLDGLTLDEVSEYLGLPVRVVPVDGGALFDALRLT